MSETDEYICVECEKVIGENEGRPCDNCSCHFCDTCYGKSVVWVEYHHPDCHHDNEDDECENECDQGYVCGGCANDWVKNKRDEFECQQDGGESDSDETDSDDDSANNRGYCHHESCTNTWDLDEQSECKQIRVEDPWYKPDYDNDKTPYFVCNWCYEHRYNTALAK